MRRLHRIAWPPFLRDDDVNALWGSTLYTTFPEFQLALCNAAGAVVAIGNTIPIVWDGTPSGLPDRIADVLAGARRAHRRGSRPTALSALAAIVDPRHRAEGLGEKVVTAMAKLAGRHGFRSLVAPVRPSWKGRYPLTPMKEYARWTRADGTSFDPWLRVHLRLGARILRITPRGNTVRATVGEWEQLDRYALPHQRPLRRSRRVSADSSRSLTRPRGLPGSERVDAPLSIV